MNSILNIFLVVIKVNRQHVLALMHSLASHAPSLARIHLSMVPYGYTNSLIYAVYLAGGI